MAFIINNLPYPENLLKEISCSTAFNNTRSKLSNQYTQSYASGLGISKEYSLEYAGLLDDDPSGVIPNVKTIEDIFSTQQTDTFLAWCPPSESYKTLFPNTGTITSNRYSTGVGGFGTIFTSLTVGMWLFSNYSVTVFAGTSLEQTTIVDTFIGTIKSISSNTHLELDTLAKETTSKLYEPITGQYRSSIGYKAITPRYFYIPTSWDKRRQETNVGGTLIFNTSLKFTLTSVY